MRLRRAAGAFALLLGLSAGAAMAQSQAPQVEAQMLDADGSLIDAAHAQASLSRTLPLELGEIPGPDRDALRFLLIAPPGAQLETLQAETRDSAGAVLDTIVNLQTEPTNCPQSVARELICRRTPALRLVPDALDRNHPAVQDRSLQARLGGSLRLSLGTKALLELPITGPRLAHGGASQRWSARLRVLILRGRAGGIPALGGTDAGARQLMARELESASALWGQCGIELGVAHSTIQLVDPPQTQLLTVGCGLGQTASGGTLTLSSARRTVTLLTHTGESPVAVALRLSEALGAGRNVPAVFENARAAGDALPTADIVLTAARAWQRHGATPLSSDPTLPLCLGQVDLSDGLSHFSDADAFSGTFEERALLRAFDDGDPRSIEVLVVPEFVHGERIGESFIASPGSSLSNSVIIDRSAILTGARSFALAHELGHVLLAMPGHPDDFGVDQSWALMDSDVADPTIFGPRRLSLPECERALTQTGPDSPSPLLEPVPAH